MAHKSANIPTRPRSQPRTSDAGARTGILVVATILVIAGVAAVWLYRSAHRDSAGVDAGAAPASLLSDSTLAVLQKLDGPVQIRFYSILDPGSVAENTKAYSSRVDQLLAAYQQAADGKIQVTRFTSESNLRFNDAPADGILPFNLDKGEPCYLGVAMEYKGRRESLPRLSLEWEQALEPDLTRAIARLVDATRPVPAPVAISQVNTTAVQEVKALIPDIAAVSVEEGKKLIQAATVKEFAAAAKEREEAQKHLTQSLPNETEADREAGRKQLQQLEAKQSEKLKQIAAKSQAQIQAFEQLKAAAQ